MSTEIEITSPLPASEAVRRLREYVGGDLPVLMLPTSHPQRPLRGWVSEHAFALRFRTAYGNSFAALCHGTIEPTASGSVLRADVGMPGATIVGGGLWFVVVLLMGVRAIVDGDSKTALTAGGFLLFGVGLVAIGRALARAEARRIVEQLREIVEAAARVPAA